MIKTSRAAAVAIIAVTCSVAIVSAAFATNGADERGGMSGGEPNATDGSSTSIAPTPGAIVLAGAGRLLCLRRKPLVGAA